MTSVADLKPGDKLSLKGKIFELQKKLNLIDIEQQNTPEYSFEPEITNYKLPHRENNFLDNMKKAEENRKVNKLIINNKVYYASFNIRKD